MFPLYYFPAKQERFSRFESVSPISTTKTTDYRLLPNLQNTQQTNFIPIQMVFAISP